MAVSSSALQQTHALIPHFFNVIDSITEPKSASSLPDLISLFQTMHSVCDTVLKAHDYSKKKEEDSIQQKLSNLMKRLSLSALRKPEEVILKEENKIEEVKNFSSACSFVCNTLTHYQKSNKEKDKPFQLSKFAKRYLEELVSSGNSFSKQKEMKTDVVLFTFANNPHFSFIQKTASNDNPLLNEAYYTQLCSHPNVLSLGILTSVTNYEISFVLPYMRVGTLEKVPFTSLDEQSRLKLFLGLLKGIHHIHALKIVHNDLKPENILVEQTLDPDSKETTYTAKIADFGFATEHLAKICCGSPYYTSPESLKIPARDFPSDIWSLGSTFFTLFYGVAFENSFDYFFYTPQRFYREKKLFYEEQTQDTFNNFLDSRAKALKPSKFPLSLFLRLVFKSCLQLNPKERPSAKDLVGAFTKKLPTPCSK